MTFDFVLMSNVSNIGYFKNWLANRQMKMEIDEVVSLNTLNLGHKIFH